MIDIKERRNSYKLALSRQTEEIKMRPNLIESESQPHVRDDFTRKKLLVDFEIENDISGSKDHEFYEIFESNLQKLDYLVCKQNNGTLKQPKLIHQARSDQGQRPTKLNNIVEEVENYLKKPQRLKVIEMKSSDPPDYLSRNSEKISSNFYLQQESKLQNSHTEGQ